MPAVAAGGAWIPCQKRRIGKTKSPGGGNEAPGLPGGNGGRRANRGASLGRGGRRTMVIWRKIMTKCPRSRYESAVIQGVEMQRRFRVGVRLPEWSTGFALRIFEGILDFQREGGPFRLVFDQPSGGDLPRTRIDEHWDGDGLIVFRYGRDEAGIWRERGVAVVNLSAEYDDQGPCFPRVTMDNELVGRMAAEHLAELGLRDFAYVHESTRRYSAERLAGFEERVRELGGRLHRIDVPISSFPEAERPRRIERVMWPALAALPRPCGIFVKDDIAAVCTLRVIEALGVSCPAEMPVLGVDDDVVFCHMTQPALSSVAYPGREVGYRAAALLHEMMRDSRARQGEGRLRLPPRGLARRESTRHVVLKDPVVTKALAFIRREVIRRNVTVSELARHCGVSRELLRQRFHGSLGHSPQAEIERLRLRHVVDVLKATNWTLEGIAESCGFSGGDEVCRFVKRASGRTPGAIRREER